MLKQIALAAAATTSSIVLSLSSTLAAPAAAAIAPPASSCEIQCDALGELAGLRAAVDELVFQAGLARSLDAKVDAATRSVLADRPTTALNQLDAFDNELTAADQAGKVSTTTSSILKARSDASKQGAISYVRG